MKRVLLIGSTEFQGGIESFIKRLVTQLHESYSFSILQFRDAQIVDFSYFTETLNVPVYKVLIPGGALGILQRERIANRFFENHKFDIVHINTNSPSSYFWAKAALKSGIKVIYQSHNGSAETFAGKNVPKSILNLIRNYQRKKLLSLNTTNIQVSDVAGEWMFGPDYDVKNTYVNGIQLDGFEFSFKKREELRKRYNISNNARVVLMASRIVEQKNVFRSLRISETGVDESDFDFAFFIGEGPLSEKLSNQISKLNKVMQSRIFYEGVQKDMQAWFSFADVLLMPSYYEGLPYTAIEAQANGLPVVLSESITRQVKVTSLTHYVSLDSSDHTWANTIASSIRADDRKKYNERLANSAYSMMNFSQKFDLLYQKQ